MIFNAFISVGLMLAVLAGVAVLVNAILALASWIDGRQARRGEVEL